MGLGTIIVPPPNVVGAAAVNLSAQSASWISRLALPLAQTGAMLPILNYQSKEYDKIENRKVNYLNAANEAWTNCVCEVLDWVKLATDDNAKPAVFQPVQPAGQQLETIASNEENLFYGDRFVKLMNKYQREYDLARAVAMNPDYYKWRDLKVETLGSWLEGQLSVGKLLNVTTDAAENSVIAGRFGLDKKLTARMIGMEQEELKLLAMREIRSEEFNANQNVHPLARNAMLEGYMLKPQDALNFALQQAVFLQNSLQNEYEAYARKDPYLKQQVNLMLTKCLNSLQVDVNKAANVSNFVPNYAAVFNRQIGDFANAAFDGVSSMFGGPSATQITGENRGWAWPEGTRIAETSERGLGW